MNLMATRVLSVSCGPSPTVPMPPVPMRRSTRYLSAMSRPSRSGDPDLGAASPMLMLMLIEASAGSVADRPAIGPTGRSGSRLRCRPDDAAERGALLCGGTDALQRRVRRRLRQGLLGAAPRPHRRDPGLHAPAPAPPPRG